MALMTCPDCGGSVSDAAPSCIHCGRPMELDSGTEDTSSVSERDPISQDAYSGEALSDETETVDTFPFFPVSTGKFVAMSLCTFGIYELYWYYKNWERVRARTGETLSPFWRAFFAPLWSFSLFRRVREYQDDGTSPISWSPGLLGTIYLVLIVSWRLPDPWWLVSLGTFVPILPVLNTTQAINARTTASESLNESVTGGNVVILVLGGLLLLFGVIGTFLPA